MIKKVGVWPRECVFRNQRGRFSPYGYRMKELCKKDGILAKNVFDGENSIFGGKSALWGIPPGLCNFKMGWDSGMMIKKRSEFDLGSAFFGINEVDVHPMGTE